MKSFKPQTAWLYSRQIQVFFNVVNSRSEEIINFLKGNVLTSKKKNPCNVKVQVLSLLLSCDFFFFFFSLVRSRWREPAPMRRPVSAACPCTDIQGKLPSREQQITVRHQNVLIIYILLCSGSTQTLTHTSFAQCTHSRGNLRLVHFADSAYFYCWFFQAPAAARMSRPTQNCLILVLLMWTVVLSIASIIQGLFIVLFFTTGQPDEVRRLNVLACLVCLFCCF